MRFPMLVSTAAVVAAGMIAALGTPARADDDHSTMPGMNHDAVPVAAGPGATAGPDLPFGVKRSRQRAYYFAAAMTGRQEVPVAGGPATGDRDARAVGLIRVQGNRVSFSAKWTGMQAASLFHIHQGKAGVNGDVKVPLLTTALPDTVTAAAGVATVEDAQIADAIVARPGNFYLNLHTAEFPGGAARGQLRQIGKTRLLALLKGGKFEAFMDGDQEVPVAGGPAVGDEDGHAAGFVASRGRSLTYSFAWTHISEPTLGHIHQGKRGTNGDVVVPLFGTPMPEGVVAVSGTVADVDPAILTQVKRTPGAFYLNLHTQEKPGGAVRGQLTSRH